MPVIDRTVEMDRKWGGRERVTQSKGQTIASVYGEPAQLSKLYDAPSNLYFSGNLCSTQINIYSKSVVL